MNTQTKGFIRADDIDRGDRPPQAKGEGWTDRGTEGERESELERESERESERERERERVREREQRKTESGDLSGRLTRIRAPDRGTSLEKTPSPRTSP